VTTGQRVLPDELEAAVGGYPGPWYEVEWNGSVLTYVARGVGSPGDRARVQEVRELVPRDEAWQRFWFDLDACRAWDWAADYPAPDVADGTHWSVRIRRGLRSLDSRGDNAYPRGFKQFTSAIGRLAGNSPFE
jgi:hypothetical protein